MNSTPSEPTKGQMIRAQREGVDVSEIAKRTTLYRGVREDGTPILQWVHENFKAKALASYIDRIREAFGEPVDQTRYIAEAFDSAVLVNVFPIADLHFGMYAWKEETGDDYDTTIANKTLTDAMENLLSRMPHADIALILNLGDYFHSDNDENRTRRSGNKVDMDTRFARVQREGIRLLRKVTNMALQSHRRVIVKNIPGNHDPYGTIALTNAMAMAYDNDSCVLVDTCADPIWVHRFGRTLLAAAHGDMVKPRDLPGTIAGNHADLWGQTEWRYGYLGHIHQLRRRKQDDDAAEFGGMEVEVFRTLAPKDSFASSMGYTARRSLVGITHHYSEGEVDRKTVNVRSRSN